MNKEVIVKEQIKQFLPQMKTILPDEKKVSQYATALKQLAFNRNLQNCDIDSVLQTGFEIVVSGLNPNPLFGQAYVVPYGRQAQLQIGYKGWVALGYRYGWKFRAVAVYDVDDFSMEFKGLTDEYHLVPNWNERQDDNGEWVYSHLKGVIVYAKDSYENEYTEFVSFKKLEKIRKKNEFQTDTLEKQLISKSGKRFENIWYQWAEEMYRAKALKYVITRLPIQEEIQAAAIKEDEPLREQETGHPKQTEHPTQPEQTIDPLQALQPDKQEEPAIDADIEEPAEAELPNAEVLKQKLRESYKAEADTSKKAEIMKAAQSGDTEQMLEMCQNLGI